jgi:hypothetical protein
MGREWGIDWDGPTVEPSVLEALAELAPKSELMPWLHLYWEPGETWCPVERFVLANMVPKAVLRAEHNFYQLMTGETYENASLYSELEGPNPRAGGHYDEVLERYIHDENRLPPSITQRQWLLYHEHGAHALPCWIVQGTKGGHKRHFNELEQLVLKTRGRPFTAPVPGQKGYPFAHPDSRMVDAMRKVDQLMKFQEETGKDFRLRTDKDVVRTKDRRKADFHNAIYDWLDSQLEEVA